MAIDSTKINAFVEALTSKFENKQTNKKTDISGNFSNDTASYPTVQAVKTYTDGVASNLQDQIDDLDENAFSGSYNDLSDKPDLFDGDYTSLSNKPNLSAVATSGSYNDLTNKPTLATVATSGSYNDLSNKPELFSGSYDDLTNAPNLAAVATSGDYEDLINTPTLSDLGGEVNVVKQSSAEAGYLATYYITQDGSQVGSKINIPKDYLVKSAEIKTVTTANSPEQGYAVGDKYLEFIINTKDDSATDAPLRVNVKDLIDTYTADESTITLSNNQFKIKNNGITTTQLASSIVTSLGYADDFNSSAAKGITSADIVNWNSKGTSNLTTQDVDDEIEAYLTAITNAL